MIYAIIYLGLIFNMSVSLDPISLFVSKYPVVLAQLTERITQAFETSYKGINRMTLLSRTSFLSKLKLWTYFLYVPTVCHIIPYYILPRCKDIPQSTHHTHYC